MRHTGIREELLKINTKKADDPMGVVGGIQDLTKDIEWLINIVENCPNRQCVTGA